MLLLHWSMLNYAAVVKILKKHGGLASSSENPSRVARPSLLVRFCRCALHCCMSVRAITAAQVSPRDLLSASLRDADKNSGVVLRAPFLATVLKQVMHPRQATDSVTS